MATSSKKRSKRKGFFVVFEGGEASGKSTQIGHLTQWLEREKKPFLLTRQPGGSKLGERVRSMLLNPDFGDVSPRAELLLYEADRAQHVETVIRPALEAGKIVISDRYADSSTVYQGMCRKLGVDWVETLNEFATGGLRPDLVIVLDVPESIGLRRMKQRKALDRIEKETQTFHRNVRRGFLKLARKAPRRFLVIDGTQAEATIADTIRLSLSKRGPWKR